MSRTTFCAEFEIVGEALASLRRRDPDSAALIAELPRIVAFRNVLIHGYARIGHRIVWGVIEADLGRLIRTLGDLLPRDR